MGQQKHSENPPIIYWGRPTKKYEEGGRGGLIIKEMDLGKIKMLI